VLEEPRLPSRGTLIDEPTLCCHPASNYDRASVDELFADHVYTKVQPRNGAHAQQNEISCFGEEPIAAMIPFPDRCHTINILPP
jgi:hypothetical protein